MAGTVNKAASAPEERTMILRRRRPMFMVVISGAVSTVGAIAFAGRVFGLAVSLLALATIALVTVVWLTFRSLQYIAEPSEEDVVADPPPTPAEERKREALRALKDLEFERSIGNVSEVDSADLSVRYREEAKRAMRAVDEERKELRDQAERLANKAVAKAFGEDSENHADRDGRDGRDSAEGEPALEATPTPAEAPVSRRMRSEKRKEKKGKGAARLSVEPVSEPASKIDGTRACPHCDATNDTDAAFCKKCGKPMSSDGLDRDGSDP